MAEVARKKSIPTLVKFFNEETAKALRNEGKAADLIAGNNVLAQVPDVNDFVAGIKILLAPSGVVTIEFPHLMKLMQENQFDTIYHEHFFYFSLMTAERIFAAHGIRLFDVEELQTHGGSLRIYGCHGGYHGHEMSTRYRELMEREKAASLDRLDTYEAFSEQVKETKRKLLEFLIEAKRKRKTVAGYGAPGKGNTLLNYCGIRTDFVDYTVDRNPYKQGKVLPGTHIPIFHPDKIRDVIGKGGVTIRGITEQTGTTIDIQDDGTVVIACVSSEGGENARKRIEDPSDEEEAPKYRVERWEVTLHNFKSDRHVEVVVLEDLGESAEIIESSHDFSKETSCRHTATVKVEAQGKATLAYSVRTKIS